MGEFVAVSAFENSAVDEVLASVAAFFAAYDCPVERLDDAVAVDADDVLLFAPVGGWTVVLWPGYFSDLPAARFVSGDLDTLVSTVRVHDGDYWTHTLLNGASLLDRFASVPDYFTDDADEAAALARAWAGDALIAAEVLGVSVELVAPYLLQLSGDTGNPAADLQLGKAFPDDESELDDPWVFVDFWRRVGIAYPADLTGFVTRLRPAADWAARLPAGDAEL
jgi:hypothetical protein